MVLCKIKNAEVRGIVTVLPLHSEDNSETELIPEQEREAIITHTGIRQRRILANEEDVKSLFTKGVVQLLNGIGWTRESVDVLICVTQTPQLAIPSVSNQLHGDLELSPNTLCYDINSGCSGYVYGLHTIGALLNTIQKKNARAVFCCGDVSSQLTDKHDKATRPIFSDAISVTAIEAVENGYEAYYNLETAGKGQKAIYSEVHENGKQVMRLNGVDVFNYSMKIVPDNIAALLNFAGKELTFPDLFVFHQANKLINESVRKKIKVEEDKTPSTLYHYGNTASASIPLTLGLNKDKINSGWVLLSGFGVGFSVASALLHIDKDIYFNCVEV